MGDPRYRVTNGALSFDAFYKDEWGVLNSSSNSSDHATERDGFHKNVFTNVITRAGVLREVAQSFSASFNNKANPATNTALKDKSNPVPPGHSDSFPLQCYFSDSVNVYWQSLMGAQSRPWVNPINLTLYFGVGREINRHGIRSFFKNQPNMQAFMQIPGMEKPQFGVAIDDAQIKTALASFFRIDPVPYKIKVLAAFSTGSCGLNQTLLNDLVDLTAVERMVFYDCLYAQQCGNTANALRNLKSKASSKLKIVVYKTSECANSFKEKPEDCPDTAKTKCPAFPKGRCLDFNRMSVIVDNPGLIDFQGIISNLFQNRSYIALVVYRALEAAVADGVVSLNSTNLTAFNDMAALVASSPRGLTISNRVCFKFVHGSLPSTGYTLFEDWAVKNSKVINAFASKVGSVSVKDSFRNLLWENFLPGWHGGDGEEKHDLLIPEFGWEYLPY
jgi:hypothetical protein